jgi:hypothetical protein
MPPLRQARLIIAGRRSDASPMARVLIQAALGPIKGPIGTSPYRWIDRCLTVLSPLLLAATMLDLAGAPAGLATSLRVLGWSCLAGMWGVILCGPAWRLLQVGAAPGHCDAAALALLLEIARTWPGGHSDRVETILAAVGGQELDHVGDHALSRIMGNEWPGKPTLVIALAAPGAGEELLIPDHDLVKQAAESLWVPHRLAGPADGPGDVWPWYSERGAEVVFIGGRWDGEPPSSVNPEALARASQLFSEVALRWAKRDHATSAQRAADLNASRSSQNPG